MNALSSRETFRTSRLLDFASERELVAQIGHPSDRWPEVTLKELIDNALNAAEEAGNPPVVSVRLEGRVLEVADEGPGIPADVIGDIPDFSVRVSSREAYVGPTRGAQGNALKTLLAMPFALDGEAGLVEIQAHGTLHRLRFAVDQIAAQPVVRHERLPSPCTGGTVVRVHWPEDRAELDLGVLGDLLADYALINPALHLTADLGDGQESEWCPTRPDWRRWRPSEAEPALWYDTERLGRRIAAAIHHDRTRGERVRTVRALVAAFQGLSATAKQKELLGRLGLQRASLEEAFVRPDGTLDAGRIAGLLDAMRAYATPVRPRRLGELGKAHLAAGTGQVVAYRRIEIDDPHAPVLAEAALIFRKGTAGRAITVGINNSPALAGADAVPGLMRLLADALVERGDPVWFFLHLAGPGFRFADRGKSRLILPYAARERLETEIAAVLEPWHKYKKRKEREEKAELRLEETTKPEQPPTFIKAADRVIPGAYLKASDGGQLKVKPRQIGYAARDEIQELTGKPLSLVYFSQILIPDFISRHPELTADWDIIWDARGSLIEPHTGRVVPLGTTEMEDYKAGWGSYFVGGENSAGWWKTVGPRDRYGAVLVIEKEGFRPLFEQVSLLERYDICLMSTKGVSTTEGRKF